MTQGQETTGTSSPSSSPQHAYAVLLKHLVVADERQLLELGDEHPVEWVAVVKGKRAEAMRS